MYRVDCLQCRSKCILNMFILKNSFGSLVDRDIADKPYSQNTPFITPTKYTFLLNTNIKCASPACFGTSVPSSGRTECQF